MFIPIVKGIPPIRKVSEKEKDISNSNSNSNSISNSNSNSKSNSNSSTIFFVVVGNTVWITF